MLRVAKRRASIEESEFDQFFEVEFYRAGQPDLEPSMYAVTHQVVQMHAEHAARCGLNPPRHFYHMDLAGHLPRSPRPEPDDEAFRFTNEAHHVLDFENADALKSFASSIYNQRPRGVSVAMRDVREYVALRLRLEDEEWVRFCTDRAEWRKWATRS